MPNHLKHRKADRYIVLSGKSRPIYIGECGHDVRTPQTKLCRKCWLDSRPRLSSGGYLRVKGKRVFEHRRKAEQALGRSLKINEVVHHVNMVKTDNRNRNLVICGKSYHHWLHNEYARRFAREHFNASYV
jgi:hypothetical protein